MMNGFQNFMSRFMPQQNQAQAPGVPPRVDGAKRVPKRGGWQDKAYIIGAGLQDMGGGQGNLDAAQEMFAKRAEQERIGQIRDSLPEDQQRLFDLSPQSWVEAYGMPQAAPKPQYFETPQGIVGNPNGQFENLFPLTPEPKGIPAGMMEDANGNLVWRPGYLDAQKGLAGATSGARRDAVVSRPMPPRVGGGRGGAAGAAADGIPPPPGNFVRIK
jgi:hypothetical protein